MHVIRRIVGLTDGNCDSDAPAVVVIRLTEFAYATRRDTQCSELTPNLSAWALSSTMPAVALAASR
jgi:hypothetical protein